MHAEAEVEAVARRLLERGAWVSADLRVYPETVADMLSVTVGTLRNWRSQLHPLPFHRGARITYYLVDVLAYLDAQDDLAA